MEALVAGPVIRGHKTNLRTPPCVAGLIKELTGIRSHPGHVWRLLCDNGISSQRLERRAIERDDPKIRRWKRVEWPAIKNQRRGPNLHVHLRKRTEHPPQPGAHMGALGRDAGDPRDLWLKEPFDHRRPGPVPILLPDPLRQHQSPSQMIELFGTCSGMAQKNDRHLERRAEPTVEALFKTTWPEPADQSWRNNCPLTLRSSIPLGARIRGPHATNEICGFDGLQRVRSLHKNQPCRPPYG